MISKIKVTLNLDGNNNKNIQYEMRSFQKFILLFLELSKHRKLKIIIFFFMKDFRGSVSLPNKRKVKKHLSFKSSVIKSKYIYDSDDSMLLLWFYFTILQYSCILEVPEIYKALLPNFT